MSDTEQPYTPTPDEIVMGKTHMGDNFWRDLTEDEVRRGVEAVSAEAWDEGYDAGQINEHENRPDRRETNPYRKGTDHDRDV